MAYEFFASEDGDFYLDKDTGDVYMPPTSGGQASFFNLYTKPSDDVSPTNQGLDAALGAVYKEAGIGQPGFLEEVFGKFGLSPSVAKSLADKMTSPAGIATGLGALYALTGGNKPQTAGYKGSIPQLTATRTMLPQPEYQPYTGKTVMGRQFFSPVTYAPKTAAPVTAAKGGVMPARYLRGQTDGMADKIETSIDDNQPARLSHGEFVVPADVVSHLGNGNSDAGAKVLYKMMDRVRQARTGTKKQGKEINPEKFTPGGIAGYAEGGTVQRFQTGGTSTANPFAASSSGSSAAQSLSEFAGPLVGEMLGKAQALAATPYQAYTGPLTAGYSPLQEKVYSGLESLSFPSTLGKSFTDTGVAQSYMNPYLEQVLSPQLQALQRQADIQKNVIGAQAAKAGAFGGSGLGLRQNQLAAELMRQQQQATGQAYGQAYQTGLGQFNVEQGQAAGLANLLSGGGAQQRAIEQEGINALKAQFEEERKFPYAQAQFVQSMLQGIPIGTTQYTPNLTGIGQLTQSGQQLATLYDMLSKALSDKSENQSVQQSGQPT
jgi:hypothetical protein